METKISDKPKDNPMQLINNLDGLLDDSSSEEFDPIKHYSKNESEDKSCLKLELRQRSNKFAPIQTNSIKKQIEEKEWGNSKILDMSSPLIALEEIDEENLTRKKEDHEQKITKDNMMNLLNDALDGLD